MRVAILFATLATTAGLPVRYSRTTEHYLWLYDTPVCNSLASLDWTLNDSTRASAESEVDAPCRAPLDCWCDVEFMLQYLEAGGRRHGEGVTKNFRLTHAHTKHLPLALLATRTSRVGCWARRETTEVMQSSSSRRFCGPRSTLKTSTPRGCSREPHKNSSSDPRTHSAWNGVM